MTETVDRLAKVLKEEKTPVFGICLGHQLFARATGASAIKMKFDDRGHNIPCTSTISRRCLIASQNHGFAVNAETLVPEWKELFVNSNNQSNEGIYHESKP